MATDFLGNELSVGDDVVFVNYNGTSADLERGTITKIFPHQAGVGRKRRAEYKIVKLPTVLTEPVRHGRWITHNAGNPFEVYGECSVCGFEQSISSELNYCPNCGAKMDEVSE